MRAMKLDDEQATWRRPRGGRCGAARRRPRGSVPPRRRRDAAARVAVRHPQLYFKELLSADTNPARRLATADGAREQGQPREKSGGGFGKLFKGGGGDGPKGAAARRARARRRRRQATRCCRCAAARRVPPVVRCSARSPRLPRARRRHHREDQPAGGRARRPLAPALPTAGLATDERRRGRARAAEGVGSGAKVAKAARSGAKKGRAVDAPTAVASESVTREYFSGHSRQVICLSRRALVADGLPRPVGQLLLWRYRQEHCRRSAEPARRARNRSARR